ncbi:hypothetical protein SCHPADRAFT_902284 [Schizopora paradoxa]|uniref:Uncharacterized protein n=1 Tax=Schizopora paradoxa TaxID=27342 RepID=A0A0H2S185_9AGAM|nr:hypothetical protein SCHPADRAFT_902284 [Schizopora paradoxa]
MHRWHELIHKGNLHWQNYRRTEGATSSSTIHTRTSSFLFDLRRRDLWHLDVIPTLGFPAMVFALTPCMIA